MAVVRPALQGRGLDAALAGRRRPPGDQRVAQQLPRRVAGAVAVEGVGVEVAQDHERPAEAQAAAPALVVVDVAAAEGQHVVRPEADLVVVARPVAVLGPVEDRRRRMAGQDVDHAAGDRDRHVPMALGGEAEDLEFLGRVPVPELGGRRVVRQQGAGHVLPEELTEGPHPVLQDRMLGQQHHGEVAGEEAEAEGVVAAADRAVVVEVEARGHAGVRGRQEDVVEVDRRGAVLRDLEEVLHEERESPALAALVLIEVELVDQQHVGIDPLDDLGDGPRLGIGRVRELRLQSAPAEGAERGVEGRDPQRLGAEGKTVLGRGGGGQDGGQHRDDGGEAESPAKRRHGDIPWTGVFPRRLRAARSLPAQHDRTPSAG